jgi:hypothetical protein
VLAIDLVHWLRVNFDSSMPPCHVLPFIRPGVVIEMAATAEAARTQSPPELCDYCASPRLEWRKCKLICVDCRQINKSCADL